MAEKEKNVLEDEWEVVNDDGFVYRRRKRSRADCPALPAPPSPPPSGNDSDFDYKRRCRLLKKDALVKLKAKYENELREWESVSQMLQRAPPLINNEISLPLPLPSSSPSQSPCKYLVKEFLDQAEAQEALIQDLMALCNAAELLCKVHETDLKQAILDLPVWETPLALMHDVSASDSEENA